MKKVLIAAVVAAAACFAYSYEISVGTYVANPGKQVVVQVMLDNAAGLSYAGATLTYDPQILVVTKAEAGSLKSVLADDFVSTDANGTLNVSIFGGIEANATGGSGSIALVTFAVRDGTAGLYSDICISSVDIGEKTGVKDVTVGNPLKTVNGMVRVMATDAAVARLEGAQTVAPDTCLGSLALAEGDAIQASDAQTPIVVSGTVGGVSVIPVAVPVNGWAGGRYALLSTPTAGLSFALAGVEDAVFSQDTANGVTTYYATVSIDGEVPVVCEGETLSAGAQNQIRELLGDTLKGASEVRITGPKGLVALIADMGIAPNCTKNGTVVDAAYSMPEIKITSFDPVTGAVRIKVTPGAGNTIVSEIATGYLHVYGTSDLTKQMTIIDTVGYDLTPYLKDSTKGEAVLNVTLGTHTFLKVKIEK